MVLPVWPKDWRNCQIFPALQSSSSPASIDLLTCVTGPWRGEALKERIDTPCAGDQAQGHWPRSQPMASPGRIPADHCSIPFACTWHSTGSVSHPKHAGVPGTRYLLPCKAQAAAIQIVPARRSMLKSTQPNKPIGEHETSRQASTRTVRCTSAQSVVVEMLANGAGTMN